MVIFNSMQRVGFTSELHRFYGVLPSVDLQVKNNCKGGMGISNTLQRIGFTSGTVPLCHGALQSVDLQVKNICKGGI